MFHLFSYLLEWLGSHGDFFEACISKEITKMSKEDEDAIPQIGKNSYEKRGFFEGFK